ncbi:glycosyltransferase [Lederbergia citrea]|uniref:glycosyltransferase n=1 Tax=Lederbergia citrea TaxID=2833581 RepID=UPI001BCA2AE9|nr:glycosyltransferase [Lederbergia citrea]MBS4179155.1 glycosyltransferase [Lederbergia citrea]
MSNGRPKVSVIMGIYNCAETLSQSIESIINQSFTDWEFIICDDASSDNSYEIACEYSNKYPNKIYILKNDSNIKLAATLNRCLSIASGEYIARQDGDDISIFDRLEKQVTFLDSHNEYMLVGTGMIPFDEKEDLGLRIGKLEPTKEDVPINNTFMHATIMMRKKGYKMLNGYRVTKHTRRAEDYDLWIRFFASDFKGYNLQEALYKVREDELAFHRREFKYYIDLSILVYLGCYKLKLPLKYYLFILKPIIVGLTPRFLVRKYHRYRAQKYIIKSA